VTLEEGLPRFTKWYLDRYGERRQPAPAAGAGV